MKIPLQFMPLFPANLLSFWSFNMSLYCLKFVWGCQEKNKKTPLSFFRYDFSYKFLTI